MDVEGKTPLHWAASSGGTVAARAKLKGCGAGGVLKGADPAKTVKILVDAAPNVLNWQDYEGRMPLHLGALIKETLYHLAQIAFSRYYFLLTQPVT